MHTIVAPKLIDLITLIVYVSRLTWVFVRVHPLQGSTNDIEYYVYDMKVIR